MNLTHHRLSRRDLTMLGAGGSGAGLVRELVGVEYSKHMTFLWGVVAAAKDSEQYQLARTGYALLAEAMRTNANAAGTVIRYPSVGAWARRTVRACLGGPAMPGAEPGQLRAVAAAAAIRAGLSTRIEVPVTDGRVTLPSLGAALIPGGGAAVVRSDRGGAVVDCVEIPQDASHDAPGWLGLRRVRVGPLDVLIDDLDPFRMPDVHDLVTRPDTDTWDAALRTAWPVLEHHHSGVAAEIATAVSVIVPRSQPPSGVVSTSSPETFGTIAMSLPPDPVTCAVTFAHEIQHLKLGALLDMATLTLPDDGGRYYAPWRDDPRPLGSLLQGAYAYLGVSAFWRRQRKLPGRQLQADVEFARWRAATSLAVEALRSSGRLTNGGLEFVSAMARTLGTWQDEPVPIQAMTLARHASESHLARWQSMNGPIPMAADRGIG